MCGAEPEASGAGDAGWQAAGARGVDGGADAVGPLAQDATVITAIVSTLASVAG